MGVCVGMFGVHLCVYVCFHAPVNTGDVSTSRSIDTCVMIDPVDNTLSVIIETNHHQRQYLERSGTFGDWPHVTECAEFQFFKV